MSGSAREVTLSIKPRAGGPSSGCNKLEMMFRNSGHGENIRLRMGIFTICIRKRNTIPLYYFHGALLAVCTLILFQFEAIFESFSSVFQMGKL